MLHALIRHVKIICELVNSCKNSFVSELSLLPAIQSLFLLCVGISPSLDDTRFNILVDALMAGVKVVLLLGHLMLH